MINDEYKISSENPQQSNQQQINQQQINQQQVMQKSESLLILISQILGLIAPF